MNTSEIRPVLLVVHDATDVRAGLEDALRERFGTHYDIEVHDARGLALAALRRHANASLPVALIFSGDSSTCGAADLFTEAHELHPTARRVLLIGRGEWSKLHPAVGAMRSGQADSYIFVPWGPRERWLYLPVSEFLAEWEASQPPKYEAVRVVGEEWEPQAHAVRDLFSRIGLPFRFHAADSLEGQRLLHEYGLDGVSLPVLAFRTGTVLARPAPERLAQALGFSTEPETDRCDLAILGAGPAGLAAAVYGASEGLSTTLIETDWPGGQAGTSSRIRNYLGFPNGVSGRDLANRALEQAWFFGARIVLAQTATELAPGGTEHLVSLSGGQQIAARTVLVSTGVTWRKLDVPSLESLQDSGVFYGAAASDVAPVEDATVFVVGAGNSAGQAAVHLARSATSVTLVVRGDGLGRSMSDYLVHELDRTPNIDVRLQTEVVDASGGGRLTALTLRDNRKGSDEEVPADVLFVMIGARPHTHWLRGSIACDDGGYILTGGDLTTDALSPWPLERAPLLLETSVPGIFAAGDVRHGSVKRVAAAVGDGSTAVQLAHLRLAELG